MGGFYCTERRCSLGYWGQNGGTDVRGQGGGHGGIQGILIVRKKRQEVGGRTGSPSSVRTTDGTHPSHYLSLSHYPRSTEMWGRVWVPSGQRPLPAGRPALSDPCITLPFAPPFRSHWLTFP